MPHNQEPSPEDTELTPEQASLTTEQVCRVTHDSITEVALLIVESFKNTNEQELQSLWREYGLRTEEFIDSLEDPNERTKAQIAAIINKGLIFQSSGNDVRYLEELDTAEVYASNEGFTTVSAQLDAEIKNSIEKLGITPEKIVLLLRGVIGDHNREFLKDSINEGADIEDILGDAYGMIIEEGEDPDEVFTDLGITQ